MMNEQDKLARSERVRSFGQTQAITHLLVYTELQETNARRRTRADLRWTTIKQTPSSLLVCRSRSRPTTTTTTTATKQQLQRANERVIRIDDCRCNRVQVQTACQPVNLFAYLLSRECPLGSARNAPPPRCERRLLDLKLRVPSRWTESCRVCVCVRRRPEYNIKRRGQIEPDFVAAAGAAVCSLKEGKE